MSENNDKKEPFSEDVDLNLKQPEDVIDKKEKLKIILILSVPVIFIIGLIIILIVVLNSGEKKETKKNKIIAKYEIFSNNSDYNILGFLNESMNDVIELMKIDNKVINNSFKHNFDSVGNHTLEIHFKKNLKSCEKMFQNCR